MKLNWLYNRRMLLVLFLISFYLPSSAQTGETVIEPQFDIRFSSKEDKENLSRLRDFLENKDLEYSNMHAEIEKIDQHNLTISDSAEFNEDKKKLELFLAKNNHTDPYNQAEINGEIEKICEVASSVKLNDSNGKSKLFYVQFAYQNVQRWIRDISRKVKLLSNLDNISKDKASAIKAIQAIYNVEKGNQEYKKTISLYYAIIILLLILVSFLFLYTKSSKEIGNDFLNGNGLQFIALFAIIISTILFGILGILEGKELAAILSGISGFILGKGLNVNLTNHAHKADTSINEQTIKHHE